ncbi:MAG TPA: 23S rRNA (guanosine(2251)-2'-O)-methyltransferase RlmB [Burkholderiales bacterium]|nr:23S rRNA (guanosine(2251)-2'-O)-methyltransferase RlmB [Burkholderiales bacterium]
MSKAIVFGFHAVSARLRQRAGTVKEILIDAQRHDARVRKLLEAASAAGVGVRKVAGRRLTELVGGAPHQGVVAFVEQIDSGASLESVLASAREPALLLVLDGVQDPHNLGACLRVADAMGAQALVVPRDRTVGLTPTVEKVASGAAQSVPYITVTNLARTLRELQERGLWVVGAAQQADAPLAACDLTRACALVLGAEGAGLRRLTAECCDELAAIPMMGTVESLNVSVAAGICLYEARRQRAGRSVSP